MRGGLRVGGGGVVMLPPGVCKMEILWNDFGTAFRRLRRGTVKAAHVLALHSFALMGIFFFSF